MLPAYAFADISDDITIKLMAVARDHITQAKLRDGSFVPPETAEEKKMPIIPVADGKRIVNRGATSAIAAWCGIDYKPYYLEFMQEERRQYQWSDKQIAYIGLLHGLSVSGYSHALQERTCSPAQREHTLKQLTN